MLIFINIQVFFNHVVETWSPNQVAGIFKSGKLPKKQQFNRQPSDCCVKENLDLRK